MGIIVISSYVIFTKENQVVNGEERNYEHSHDDGST